MWSILVTVDAGKQSIQMAKWKQMNPMVWSGVVSDFGYLVLL
jgi:hypothetical protein